MNSRKQKLSTSFRHALEGILVAFKTQRNIRIHVTLGIVVIVAALYLGLPPRDIALLLLVISLVIAAELVNTAIEAVVDLVTSEWHALAKMAKDTAAGAVLVSAGFAVSIGLILFYRPVMIWLGLY
ncbi:diacylglycerol kinase family protein [Paenibacillus segetis]|uniref:Diacylglycerol kinase n=1 Tax=Paenibacillus segetis TaxID=1325360 RepID=A0ABQ1YJE0_9BACL|nr:diacylglycerol kinase family protein [Paenibacillus segetis]GGH26689.1 hypothetical protein GCM10008013_27650 [Paenibacillus segetis]